MSIVYKDITQPKLTIAKDRVELKLPSVAKINDEGRIIVLANKVASEVGMGFIEKTLRGRFNLDLSGKWSISMYSGTATNNVPRKLFKTFREQ